MTAIDSGRTIGHARRLAEAGDLEHAASILADLAADAAAPERAEAALGLSVVVERMAQHLLAEGEPGQAADALLRALAIGQLADMGRLRVLLGLAHLDMACAEFAEAVREGSDADTGALAIELLARTLPLRGRDTDAEAVWDYGLSHPDEVLAEQVRLRIARD